MIIITLFQYIISTLRVIYRQEKWRTRFWQRLRIKLSYQFEQKNRFEWELANVFTLIKAPYFLCVYAVHSAEGLGV